MDEAATGLQEMRVKGDPRMAQYQDEATRYRELKDSLIWTSESKEADSQPQAESRQDIKTFEAIFDALSSGKLNYKDTTTWNDPAVESAKRQFHALSPEQRHQCFLYVYFEHNSDAAGLLQRWAWEAKDTWAREPFAESK